MTNKFMDRGNKIKKVKKNAVQQTCVELAYANDANDANDAKKYIFS